MAVGGQLIRVSDRNFRAGKLNKSELPGRGWCGGGGGEKPQRLYRLRSGREQWQVGG